MRRSIRAGRTRAVVLCAVLAATVTAAVTLYPGSSGATPQPSPTVEAAPAASFQILRGVATQAPEARIAAAAAHAPSGFGLDLQGARRSAGTGAWLIPGEGELCIAVEDPEGIGMSCASAAVAAHGGLAFVERSDDGGPSTIVGAAPDGMTQANAHAGDGSILATAQVQDNTYVVRGQGISGASTAP